MAGIAPAPASCPPTSPNCPVLLQAPAKPKTPYGEMLQYYLKMEPGLFRSAVDDQLQKLKAEKDAQEARKQQHADSQEGGQDKAELTLYK